MDKRRSRSRRAASPQYLRPRKTKVGWLAAGVSLDGPVAHPRPVVCAGLQQAQTALDAKEAHAEERLAQMTRLKAEAEYAQQQTAIAVQERLAAIAAVEKRIEYQQLQAGIESGVVAETQTTLLRERKRREEAEALLEAAQSRADSSAAEASAAKEEYQAADAARLDSAVELRRAVRLEKVAAEAARAVRHEIQVRKAHLKQERQERALAEQERQKARATLATVNSAVKKKMAVLNSAVGRAEAAVSEAAKLHREAAEVAEQSKRIVAKQSERINEVSSRMAGSEERAANLQRKHAKKSRLEALALAEEESTRPPLDAPKRAHRRQPVTVAVAEQDRAASVHARKAAALPPWCATSQPIASLPLHRETDCLGPSSGFRCPATGAGLQAAAVSQPAQPLLT